MTIRLVRPEDAEAMAALLRANREHLAPWDPVRPDSYFTLEGQRDVIARQVASLRAGTEYPFVIEQDGAIVGRVTISNVVRGPLQSANLGYWIDHERQGTGLTTRAAAAAVNHARDELGLHRLEAGTLVHNTGSQRVLEKLGFVRYGLAPGFLNIAGRWQDHVLFQLLLHDRDAL
ncbi:ribosomal-protein-alanine N-acetyltransferase [Marmoricola sp. OAE513]|uniref:GNAT family N-acetyltransferase n=1 Tax=Marmoricola sp. OAE513 TaxID=2817894 RepID=UPI001D259A35